MREAASPDTAAQVNIHAAMVAVSAILMGLVILCSPMKRSVRSLCDSRAINLISPK
jgi:hypothetical protein